MKYLILLLLLFVPFSTNASDEQITFKKHYDIIGMLYYNEVKLTISIFPINYEVSEYFIINSDENTEKLKDIAKKLTDTNKTVRMQFDYVCTDKKCDIDMTTFNMLDE